MIPNTHNLESNISAAAIISLHVAHYAYPETRCYIYEKNFIKKLGGACVMCIWQSSFRLLCK